MRWSIIDPEPTSFDEIEFHTKQAIQQAHAAIWGLDDWFFRVVKEIKTIPSGQNHINAPAGSIVNIKADGANSYLRHEENPDFPAETSGAVKSFWVEADSDGNRLMFRPVPETDTDVQIRYLTLLKARAADGTPKANLELEDDYINIPPEWEEPYLNALKNKAMVYLIVDNTDENWLPYKEQFEEQYQVALTALRGVKSETFIRV